MNSLIATAREQYHNLLLDEGVLTIDAKGIPSNADKSSVLSIKIAKGITETTTSRRRVGGFMKNPPVQK